MHMKKSPSDEIQISYSTPDSFKNEVTVFMVLPDNTTEAIGKVYPDLSKGEDSLIYISTNNQGIEIFPPTSDFIEIENRFEKYAKELAEISFMEELKVEFENYQDREESIKSLRNLKLKLAPKLINR
jgi:hypothetical protein